MTKFWMLYTKKFYVNGVSVWYGVRSYCLSNFREHSPVWEMFRVYYSSLYRSITLVSIMFTLNVGVSFFPFKTQPVVFPQSHVKPVGNLWFHTNPSIPHTGNA